MADEEQKVETAEKSPEEKIKEAPAPAVKKAGVKVDLQPLKVQKKEARENKDRKRVDILRRRMNRMKKRARKAKA